MCQGGGFDPKLGYVWEASHRCFSSLSPPPLPPPYRSLSQSLKKHTPYFRGVHVGETTLPGEPSCNHLLLLKICSYYFQELCEMQK